MPYPTAVPKWRRHLRFWRADVAADVDDELRFHFEARAEELRARGVPADEIERTIAAEFGDVEATRRRLREIGERVERRRERAWWWHRLLADLRYTLRGVRRAPGFAAAVVATLALGIGANAAVFAAVDRLLFRPPPLLDAPARTHLVYFRYPPPQGEGEYIAVDKIPYARFVEFTDAARSFERTALTTVAMLRVGAGDDAPELPVGVVSASFFGFFHAPPALGRYFGPSEDGPPSGSPVVVLSHATWQSRFGGRPDVLGATVRIGTTTYTVIGVAPRHFAGLTPERPPAAFVPFAAYAAEAGAGRRGARWWSSNQMNLASMLVRRRPGVTEAAASADLTTALVRDWDVRMAPTPLGRYRPRAEVASVLAERGPNRTSAARVAALSGAMAVVVLLIAFANVANLLLARALRRRREVAVRLALGVSRVRLLSQLLVESAVLAVLGGAAGLLVAQWGGTALRAALLPSGAAAPVIADPRTLGVVGAVVLAAALLTGLAPASQARRVEVTRHLRAGAREGTRRRSRVRVALLVTQGALSVLLLVGAGLFVRSLVNARRVRLGYDVTPVLHVQLRMRGARLDSADAAALRERLLAAARRVPGVERAALALSMPFTRTLVGDALHVPGFAPAAWERLPDVYFNVVAPEFFGVMGTHIVRGRGFGPEDVRGAPGAIVVSESLARTLWAAKDPLGQCVKLDDGPAEPCAVVVGVVEDIKNVQLGDDPGLMYYLAAAQHPRPDIGLALRTRGDAAHVAGAVRQALQREMPGAAVADVDPLAEVLAVETRSWRLGTTMFVVHGLLALALAAVGLYAVVAYDVEQRAHEVGVRVALGAGRGDVVWMVVRQGVLLGALGVAVGGALAIAASRRVAPLLFDVSPRDPMVYALVAAAMLIVATAASLIPARRAARVDPNVALRAE